MSSKKSDWIKYPLYDFGEDEISLYECRSGGIKLYTKSHVGIDINLEKQDIFKIAVLLLTILNESKTK